MSPFFITVTKCYFYLGPQCFNQAVIRTNNVDPTELSNYLVINTQSLMSSTDSFNGGSKYDGYRDLYSEAIPYTGELNFKNPMTISYKTSSFSSRTSTVGILLKYNINKVNP